ncbi:MAG: hypothetical protein PHO23_02870 [Candidatus Pacebacteria bacterium]|nr:hypothetical protein [Candidatus Paceibacterota bacterium]
MYTDENCETMYNVLRYGSVKNLGNNQYEIIQETTSLRNRDKLYVKIQTINLANDNFV